VCEPREMPFSRHFPGFGKLLTFNFNYDKFDKAVCKNGFVNFFLVLGEVAQMRVGVTLACTECKRRNYTTVKNKKNDANRIEMKKYCRFCQTHTLHKETR
jgi:large subunit ribosomal protein L33